MIAPIRSIRRSGHGQRPLERMRDKIQWQKLSPATWPALVQGSYYLITGIWPLIHMRSFETVTGPKTDRWLVRTVGVLVGVMGASLLTGWRRGSLSSEAKVLAVGGAAGFAGIDLFYVARKRIRRIYLADAAAQLALIAIWAATDLQARRSRRQGDRM